MVDSVVDTARQLSVTAMKNLKKLINAELSGPQGPSVEYAGDMLLVLLVLLVAPVCIACIACIACICIYHMYCMY